jgi:hypothetical protein
VVRVLLTGAAQPRADSVQRAMEILKDRPLPQPKPDNRRNFNPRPKKPERQPE